MDQYQILNENQHDGGVTSLNGSVDSQYQTFEGRRSTGSDGGVRSRERSGSVTSIGGKASTVRNFLTVLALSLHAVFEGLAVGLEDSSNSMWTLFAAVALHKYVLSFCVGLELWTSGKNSSAINISYILVYAIMSPIGIAVGIAVTSLQEPSASYYLTVGVLQALAGGTILYVVVFEVLQRERSKQHVPGLLQLAFVTIGFLVMTLVEVYG